LQAPVPAAGPSDARRFCSSLEPLSPTGPGAGFHRQSQVSRYRQSWSSPGTRARSGPYRAPLRRPARRKSWSVSPARARPCRHRVSKRANRIRLRIAAHSEAGQNGRPRGVL